MTSCPLCTSSLADESGPCSFCGASLDTKPKKLGKGSVGTLLDKVSKAIDGKPEGLDLKMARSLLEKGQKAFEKGDVEKASSLAQALERSLDVSLKRSNLMKKLSGARDRIAEAKRAGADVKEAEASLATLEDRLELGSFDGVAKAIGALLKGLDPSGRLKQVEASIASARKKISYARERGGNTAKALEFLGTAESALKEGELQRANDLVLRAVRAAEYARKNARALQLISSAERELENATKRGADIAGGEELLQNARKALKSGVYADVSKWTRATRELGDRARRKKVAEDAIHKVEKGLEEEAKEGSDLSSARPFLEESWKALDDERFSAVRKALQKVRRIADEAARIRKAKESLDFLRSDIIELQHMKAETSKAEATAQKAEKAFEALDWKSFRQQFLKANRAAQKSRKEREKELVLGTVEKLVEKAGKGGVSAIGARELLAEVEKALGRGRYTDIDTLVEAKFEAEATKKENEILREIGELRTVTAELKVAGIEVSAAMGLLDKAEEALSEKDISQSQELLRRAGEVSEGLKDALKGSADRAIRQLAEELERLGAMEIQVPQAQEFLERGIRAIKDGSAFEALDLARLALEECARTRKAHFDDIAAMELEGMRSAAALDSARGEIQEAKEFCAILKRAGIDPGALEEASERAEEALNSKDVNNLSVRLQVMEQLGKSFRASLRGQLESWLDELQGPMKEYEAEVDAEGANVERVRNALEEDALELALEEYFTLERIVEGAADRKTREDLKTSVQSLKELSTQFVRVKRLLDELRKAGIDVTESESRLQQAEKALQKKDVSTAEPVLSELEEMASSVRGSLISAARDLIAAARLRLTKASKNWERIPEAEELLRNAEDLFQRSRFDEAIEVAKLAERKARTRMERFIDEANTQVAEKIRILEGRLTKLREVMKDLSRADISIEGADAALEKVEDALEEADFDVAETHLASVEEMAEALTSGLKVAAEDLLGKTGEVVQQGVSEGLSIPRGEQVFETANDALQAGRYVETLEYCKVIEDIVEGARQKATLEDVSAYLDSIRSDVEELESRGMKLARTDGLLRKIEQAASRGELEKARLLAESLDNMVKDLRGTPGEGEAPTEEIALKVDEVRDLLSQLQVAVESGEPEELKGILSRAQIQFGGGDGAQTLLQETMEEVELAEGLGVDVGEARKLFEEAEAAFQEEPATALKSIEKARQLVREAVRGTADSARPDLVVELPEEGLEEGRWTSYQFYLRNVGDMPAREVSVRLRGEIDVRGLEPIAKMPPGEEREIEVGIKPKVAGEIPIDVEVAYRRYFNGREVQTAKKHAVVAHSAGTYVVEDVFLVHSDGRLVSHQSRKTLDDIDEDIFSGMLTVVQDFVRDSFRQRTRVGLRRLEFGESKIIIERGTYVYLATVLMGREPELLPLYMAEVINEIERAYGEKLEKWSGLLSDLKGIDEVVRKLIFFTQEEVIRGPEGTETAIGSALSLIKGGKALGMDLSESEELLQAAKETVADDPAKAWTLIQDAVEKALKTQQDLQKRLTTGLEGLEGDLKDVAELGFGLEGGGDELERARRSLAKGEYDVAARIVASLEDSLSGLKEQVVSQRIDRELERLALVLASLEREGADISEAKTLMERARGALGERKLGEVTKCLESADAVARKMKDSFLLERYEGELKKLTNLLQEASLAGVVPEEAQEILEKAADAAERSDVDELELLVTKARKATSSQIDGTLEGKEPRLHVKIPRSPVQSGTWNRFVMEVVNKGDWPAKNVEIKLGGDVKIRGGTKIDGIDPDETCKLELGLWPTVEGEAAMDVEATYARALDDAPYVMRDIRDLQVLPKRTYLVEDVLLLLPSGELLVHETSKFREDVDEDGFTAMLQAAQKLITKDGKVTIESMEFGESRILLESGDSAVLVAVVLGKEPELLPLYMLEVLKEIEDLYGEGLEDLKEEVPEQLRQIVRKVLLVTDTPGVDLGPLASSPVTIGLLHGSPPAERGARVKALVKEIRGAMEAGGLDKAIEVMEASLGREMTRKVPEAPKGPRPPTTGYSIEVDDASLKEYIEIVKDVDKAINKARGKAGLEFYWPVPRIAIRATKPAVAAAATSFKGMILSHANAKEADILQEGEIWKSVDLKMQIHEETLAKAYRVWAKKIELILKSQNPWKIKAGIDRGGYEMGIEGQVIHILPGMVSFQAIIPPHIVVQDFRGGMVFMDTSMTEETKAEGFANEVIRIILEARKELALEDSVPVTVKVTPSEDLKVLLSKMRSYIMEEANVKDLRFVEDAGETGYVVDCEIREETFTIAVDEA